MTTYEQPKDWIERHLVEDPGGLLACEPSGLNEELKLARQANEFQHQTIKKQAAQIATMRETALNQQKREVMLRDALEYHQAQTRPIQRTEEALAATADLDGLILCEKNNSTEMLGVKLYRAWEPNP